MGSLLRPMTSLALYGWLGFQLPGMIFFLFRQPEVKLDSGVLSPTHKYHNCTFTVIEM